MRGRGAGSLPGMLVLGLVGLGLLAWAVAVKSPLFALRHLRVVGNVRLSATEIAGLAGIEEGRNLLTLSLERIEAGVGASPWVARVDAERDLPSALVLRVEERSPVAWVGDPEGGAAVASDGTVLARRAAPRRLAAVGSVPRTLAPGDRVGELAPAVRVVAGLAPRLRREVASARLLDPEVVLRLRSGPLVYIGRPESLPEKGAALGSILRWAQEAALPLAAIDVRAPRTPAVRPAVTG